MGVPKNLKYSETHEWHRVEHNTVIIGITQLAADQLSDITFVDLPATGSAVSAGEAFGEIESVKATSELYSGVSGKILEVNADLEAEPELVNNEPYDGGWMIKVEASDLGDIEKLLSAAAYDKKYETMD